MRLLVTADLHFNHPRSHDGAVDLIRRMNQEQADVLLLVGDTSIGDGFELERCLVLFEFAGPKLILPGNHEMWTKGVADSWTLHEEILPRRVEALGWQWLPKAPFVRDDVAIVGSIGWYDYAFAVESLHIPRAFYEAKASPGAVLYTGHPEHLVDLAGLLPDPAPRLVARWNDRKFVKLPFSDEEFVSRECERLRTHLEAVRSARSVVAAVHTVPMPQLLPERHSEQWDFARAYLGSPKLGETITAFDNVSHILCGHSHWPIRTTVGRIEAINIGSGYREKRYLVLDI
ncbi:MAG: metallophosphoesterase [Tepidisphaeraceae bacterium]